MKNEPSCLNEIPMVAIITYEHGYDTDVDEDKESGLIKLSDVQRLVCRRIIKEREKQKGYIDDLDNWLRIEYVILVLTKDNNITDAMIEEEKRRGASR